MISHTVPARDQPNDWDRRGLPAWTYHSPAMLELEKRKLFLNHWQIACHVSDIPNTGDFITLDIAAERAIIMRGDDGVVRAFHNLCRHRGSRVAAESRGHCKNALVCPFHGWVYNLDGTLRGAARPQSFADMDRSKFGLKPIDSEIWLGFVFIRFAPGAQAGVAETMKRYAGVLGAYRMEDLVPAGEINEMKLPVNWKSVRDVDNEGYHVAMAHPALQDLYGASYTDHTYIDGVNHAVGQFNPHAGRRWSVRNYVAIAGDQEWLPENRRREWGYYGLFPNSVIAVTPESVQFYQEFPLEVGQTLLRSATYRRPQESRKQKLARYLARRIDRETYLEDIQLAIWSNESMKSSAFEDFHLSDLECGVKSHHDHIRAALPVVNLRDRPGEDQVAGLNAALKIASQQNEQKLD